MGCVNSTKKMTTFKGDDVFRVTVVRLKSDRLTMRNGFLQLTPHELIFSMRGREPVVWALQHLRRYGLTGDMFSFEAGRRCHTGPGIYTFRCCKADLFYSKFQRYINAIAMVPARDHLHCSLSVGRIDESSEGNDCLQPISAASRAELARSLSESPLRPAGHLTDSISNLSLSIEVVHFSETSLSNNNEVTSSNIYLRQPLPASTNNNDNKSTATATLPSNAAVQQHTYANVDSLKKLLNRTKRHDCRRSEIDRINHCYENVCLDLESHQHKPCTSSINYIILDLEHPRLSAQYKGYPPTTDVVETQEPLHNDGVVVDGNVPVGSASLESSKGYSTIDFIKTYALFKSRSREFDDIDELRFTNRKSVQSICSTRD